MTPRSRRGPYAKGMAKREEILTRVLEVIAREGYNGTSVREIAAAVDLSQAGLLHYFGSKEELFTAVLRKRDEIDTRRSRPSSDELDLSGIRDGYLSAIRHNAGVPGLVELFAQLEVDAPEPDHPAHDYFVERNRGLHEQAATAIARAQADGRADPRVDPTTMARILQAAADGLQLQWMLDPEVDMADAMSALFDLLGVPEEPSDDAPE